MFAPKTISIEDFKDYDLVLISPLFDRLVAIHGINIYGYTWIEEEEIYKFYGWLVSIADVVIFLAGKEVEVYT